MRKVVNNGFKLMLVDDLSPENEAMLQALYSRSAESAEVQLEKVQLTGSERFFDKYVVGYGHKSIADCGTTTMFVEGVSLLAAKAIQDWPLYSGQETSTRYIDMGKQNLIDPVGTPESAELLRRWMAYYTSMQELVAVTIRERHPQMASEDNATYERAVKARTFDILRGFLPAGITTQLSWHTNLRQAGDHLNALVRHPSAEIRGIGGSLRGLLSDAYPSSGFDASLAAVGGVGRSTDKEEEQRREQERAAWEQKVAALYTYPKRSHHFGFTTTIDGLDRYYGLLGSRPRGCVLPHFLSDAGQITFADLLDFGSFRDIQRHRNGVCRMPLLTTELGFEPWYLEQLDDASRHAASDLVEELTNTIAGISDDPVVRQYYTALGFRVPCQVTYSLPAAVYVMELRSGKMVHPTLRRYMHKYIREFKLQFPEVALHVDMDPDDWDVRRGTQTIVART